MPNIAIVPYAEPGHVNATLRLFAELTDLGHDVRYITLLPGQDSLLKERELPYILERFSDLEEDGAAEAASALEGFRPELVLVDSMIPQIAIFAWQHGVPVLTLSTVFPQRRDPIVPPLTTAIVPTGDAVTNTRIELAWEEEYRRNRSRPRAPLLRQRARQAGFPSAWLDEGAALNTMCRVPELALVPQELDFPRSDVQDLYFAGPCVELARTENGRVPEPLSSTTKPIIYCSLGTQLHRYPDLAQALGLVIGAARSLPDFEWVVACKLDSFGHLPCNVHSLHPAPQLELLRRARLMVSHGGLNGIKEALCLGVPLVLLPFDLDQPGNAARVAHYGYGKVLEWRRARAEDLAAMIGAVLDDSAMQDRVRALSQRLVASLREKQAARACLRAWANYQHAPASPWHRQATHAASHHE
jgi:MGT family glycosyltransferase